MAWANDESLHHLIMRNSRVEAKTHEVWYEELLKSKDKIVFAIQKKDTGIHIGNVGFYSYSQEHQRAEFWILIGNKNEWHKGYGKEAVQLMLKYGFDQLLLNRIFLNVNVSNIAAKKLYEKFGFKTEGLLKEHYIIHGEKCDVFLMSILRREYCYEL